MWPPPIASRRSRSRASRRRRGRRRRASRLRDARSRCGWVRTEPTVIVPIPTALARSPTAAAAAPATSPRLSSGIAARICLYESLTLSSSCFSSSFSPWSLSTSVSSSLPRSNASSSGFTSLSNSRLHDVGDELLRVERRELVDHLLVVGVELVDVRLRQHLRRGRACRAAASKSAESACGEVGRVERRDLARGRRRRGRARLVVRKSRLTRVKPVDERLDRVLDVAERAGAGDEAAELRVEVVDELLHLGDDRVDAVASGAVSAKAAFSGPAKRAVDERRGPTGRPPGPTVSPCRSSSSAVGAGVGGVPGVVQERVGAGLRRGERRSRDSRERLERARRSRSRAGRSGRARPRPPSSRASREARSAPRARRRSSRRRSPRASRAGRRS